MISSLNNLFVNLYYLKPSGITTNAELSSIVETNIELYLSCQERLPWNTTIYTYHNESTEPLSIMSSTLYPYVKSIIFGNIRLDSYDKILPILDMYLPMKRKRNVIIISGHVYLVDNIRIIIGIVKSAFNSLGVVLGVLTDLDMDVESIINLLTHTQTSAQGSDLSFSIESQSNQSFIKSPVDFFSVLSSVLLKS